MLRSSWIALVFLIAATIACGGSSSQNNNPAGPSGGSSSSSNCFVVVGNRGTITASISGLAPFNGVVGNGAAALVPGPSFTIGALNVQDGTDVIISGQAVVGTSAIGDSTINTPAAPNRISVQTRSCSGSTGMGTGTWVAGIAFGTGTITVTAATATGVSGTFSATLLPGPGSTGNRTISGSFNATY